MAKKNKKGAAAKAAKAGGAKQTAKAERRALAQTAAKVSSDPSLKKELVAIARILPRYPANTPDEAAAFQSLASDARRSVLGGETKAVNVLREAVPVAVAIDAALQKYAATVAGHYAPARFRFLLDRIQALGDAIGAPANGAGRGDATAAAAALGDKAQQDKKRLVRALQSFAGQRDDERAELDAARSEGAAEGDPIAGSIAAFARLARTWLGRRDPTSKVLLAAAGLTSDLVDQALASARAYAAGGAEVTLAGRRSSTDTPLQNLAEGAVLVEIIEADDAFGALAEETNGVVARLPLGKSLSRVARGKPRSAKAAPAPPPPPAPAPQPAPPAAAPPAGTNPE